MKQGHSACADAWYGCWRAPAATMQSRDAIHVLLYEHVYAGGALVRDALELVTLRVGGELDIQQVDAFAFGQDIIAQHAGNVSLVQGLFMLNKDTLCIGTYPSQVYKIALDSKATSLLFETSAQLPTQKSTTTVPGKSLYFSIDITQRMVSNINSQVQLPDESDVEQVLLAAPNTYLYYVGGSNPREAREKYIIEYNAQDLSQSKIAPLTSFDIEDTWDMDTLFLNSDASAFVVRTQRDNLEQFISVRISDGAQLFVYNSDINKRVPFRSKEEEAVLLL